jgi:lysozyme
MNLDKLTAQLTKHEGFKTFPYTDTVGKLTIGIGHNLTDRGLTKSQIVAIFKDDVSEVTQFLDLKLPWWKSLDDVRARVLADMTFNLMGKILDFKGMLGAIQKSDWEDAAKHLENSLFYKQVGIRGKNLAHMLRTGTDIS